MAVARRDKDRYGLQMLAVIALLFLIMAAVFYRLQQGEPTKGAYVMAPPNSEPIYLLKSYSSAAMYQKNGMDKSQYVEKFDKFNHFLTAMGYQTKTILEDEVGKLPREGILFLLDAIALDAKAKADIKAFVANGGKLFFNFTAGFSDEKGAYIGDAFVKELTGLAQSADKNFANFKEGLFLTQKLLSPLNNLHDGVLLDAPCYDAAPVFVTPKTLLPDIMMTTYAQTTPPVASGQKSAFTLEEAGAAWHGYYGKGKWFYVSLPSYIFYDAAKQGDEYQKIAHAIIHFLSHDTVIQKYPFIDRDSAVFISEDTEYKFENLQRFSDLALKYQMPVTTFLVASLAEHPDHAKMMQSVAKNPFVEMASHSYLHDKIIDTNASYIEQETAGTKRVLDRFAAKPILGFRPPREELDESMKQNLDESGFTYVMGPLQPYLYPKHDTTHDNLLLIPRHGTDDYSYLVNLDWDKEQILEQMKKERAYLTSLNGIYALSVHTHLFSYSSNIEIIERFFAHLKAEGIAPLDGRSLAERVRMHDNIDIKFVQKNNQMMVTIDNQNNKTVENFHCKLFKNPRQKIVNIRSDTPLFHAPKEQGSEVIILKSLKPKSQTTLYIEFLEAS